MMPKPAQIFADTRSALAGGFARAKTLAGRLPRPNRRHLAALAPLMATTALMGDAAMERPVLAPQNWGHEALSANDLGFVNYNAVAQTTVLPARCYTPKEDEPNPLFNRDETSWRGFYMLANGGMFGQGLHANARALEMAICETGETDRIRNYDSTSRIAGISGDARLVDHLREATHGIMHAIMQDNNLSTPSADEYLFSRLNRHLTAEAVAMTAEYVILAEEAASGDDVLLRALRTQNAPGFDFFEEALRHARAAGLSDHAAIARAASQTISHLVRQPEFIAANSDPILRGYMSELAISTSRPRRSSEFTRGDAGRMGQVGRASIAADVRLLTPAELAALSPQVASMVEAMQTLHAQRIGYTAPRNYVSGNIYGRVSIAELQQQVTNAQGIYTPAQAFERARHARTYTYPDRTWQLSQSFTHGMQADYTLAQTPQSARPLWHNLDTLRRLSPTFGPGLAQVATERNIIMCYGRPETNQPNTIIHGTWNFDSGIVQLGRHLHGRPAYGTQTLAHELLHMMQYTNNISLYYRNWTIEDIQQSTLAREASASVISILVAMEMKLYGDNSLWTFGEDQPHADRMLDIYTQTRAGGASHQQSLTAAGLAGFQMMFERQSWLDIYNNSSARWVIRNLSQDWFWAPSGNGFTLQSARLSGKATETFNFTAGLTALPTDAMRFGSNNDMRHLHGYLELQQLVQTRGARHPDTVALRTAQQAAGNPYLDVDFAQLAAAVNNDTSRSVLQQINCLIGRGECAPGAVTSVRPPVPAATRPLCGA